MRFLLLFFIINIFSCSKEEGNFYANKLKGEDIHQFEANDNITICEWPEFDIDLKEFNDYLQNSLRSDRISIDNIPRGVYTVIASFDIDEFRRIANVRIVNDPGFDLGKKVKQAISEFRNSKEVVLPAQPYKLRTVLRQPVTFVIGDEMRENEGGK